MDLFVWFALICLLWLGIGLFIGIVIGRGTAIADEIEQPDPRAEAMRRHPSGREWVA